MPLNIEQLRAAFKKPERSATSLPNNYYPFWNMKVGEQAVVRFLPDANKENPLGFLVEKLSHTLEINGEKKTVPCLRMYGEDCPICAVSQQYYQVEDKVNGKKFWRKKQHIAQALIVEDPLEPRNDDDEGHAGTVRFISLGYQIYNIIKEAFESGELEEVPFAYENGCNFIIKKTQQGEYATYATGSRFERKETDLTPEQIEFVEERLEDLSSLIPANPGREKVEAMLEAALTGSDYSDDSDAPSTPASPPKPAKETKTVSVSKPATKVEQPATETVSESDSDGDSEVDDILAKIRARREKQDNG